MNDAALSVGAAVYPLVGGVIAVAWNAPFLKCFLGLPVAVFAILTLAGPVAEREPRRLASLRGAFGALSDCTTFLDRALGPVLTANLATATGYRPLLSGAGQVVLGLGFVVVLAPRPSGPIQRFPYLEDVGSTRTSMSDSETEDALQARVERWLTAQMPIIQMHGGTSAVQKADPEDGEVVVELGGACSGCAISPRTTQNIKIDLAKEFDEVDDVVVRVADDGGGWNPDQAESVMGIDRNEGGRGGRGEGAPRDDHF